MKQVYFDYDHVSMEEGWEGLMGSSAGADTTLYLEDVCKFYRMGNQVIEALCGVSVSFERGSFWAVTGPSGSGKSTLLNLLGCLDRPSSGRLVLENSDVNTLDDDALSELRLRHLGFVFQSFNLIPQLTVQENIELPLYYQGWEAQRSTRRARELAGLVGLGDRLNHRPMELSGGQQQRVAIARALANDPSVVLADEPTGNLDSATGEQIIQLLEGLNRRGKTIIMVTHDHDLANVAGHRMHLLDGRIASFEG
jgi:putative ABC transport system ATP-binding protein